MNVSASPAITRRAGYRRVPLCGRAHVRVRSLQAGEHGGTRMWLVPRGGEPARRRDSLLFKRHQPAQAQPLAGAAPRPHTRAQRNDAGSPLRAVECRGRKGQVAMGRSMGARGQRRRAPHPVPRAENPAFVEVDRPAGISIPTDGAGFWVHPVGNKLHVHAGEQVTEFVLMR